MQLWQLFTDTKQEQSEENRVQSELDEQKKAKIQMGPS